MPETPTPEPGMGCAIYKDRLLPLLRGELKLRMDDLDLAPLLSSAILRIEQLQALLDSHGRETPDAAELTDWQRARYGDSPETRAAIAYWRERGWAVDDCNSVQADIRIGAFKSGYRVALAGPEKESQ